MSSNQKFVFLGFFFFLVERWGSERKWPPPYKDLINFEGSSAPLVQGRVQEGGGRVGGRETDPWAD